MARFRSGKDKSLPTINTASLPDIVFILLLFFLLTSTMRSGETMVLIKLPEASEVTKLERKDLTSYINIGSPTIQHQALFGTDARIQLNDSFKTVHDIRDFIASEREGLSEENRPIMTVALKVDSGVRMGIVSDVKQELRRTSALRIMYNARKVGQ